MPLTSEELEGIDKLLARREKASRWWRHDRWLSLSMGVILMVGAFWMISLAYQSRGMAVSKSWGSFSEEEATSLQVRSAMTYSESLTIGLVGLATAALLLLSCLGDWNKTRDDLLLIKLARSCVDSQRPGPAGQQHEYQQIEPTEETLEGDNP